MLQKELISQAWSGSTVDLSGYYLISPNQRYVLFAFNQKKVMMKDDDYTFLCILVVTIHSPAFYLHFHVQEWRHSFSAYYLAYDSQLDSVFNVTSWHSSPTTSLSPVTNIRWAPSQSPSLVVYVAFTRSLINNTASTPPIII